MSNLAQLLTELRGKGVVLSVSGDEVRYRAPKGVLTEELKQRLRERKPDLIRLLAETTTSYREGPPYPDSLGFVKCCYRTHLEISDYQAKCRQIGKPRTGIALLVECSDFSMATVH